MKKIKVLKRVIPMLCATLLLLGSSITVFASSNVFHLPTDDITSYAGFEDGYDYVITSEDDGYHMYVIPSGGYFCYSNFSPCYGYLTCISDACIRYTSSDGSSWTLKGPTYFTGGLTLVESNYEVIASNVDVYVRNSSYEYNNFDEIFFQRPPIPIVELAIPLTATIQNQTAKILPIAVGCLALLIGSITLLPRLKMFLVR